MSGRSRWWPAPTTTGSTTPARRRFLESDWKLSPKSNRVGFRLEGPEWTFTEKATDKAPENGADPSNVIDHGYPIGAINLCGQTPIILMVDTLTLGGFINPYTVPTCAWWKLGLPLPPGPAPTRPTASARSPFLRGRSPSRAPPHRRTLAGAAPKSKSWRQPSDRSVPFANPELPLEIDGGHHAEAVDQDAARTRALQSHGYRVIRFWNSDVTGNLSGVIESRPKSSAPPPLPAMRIVEIRDIAVPMGAPMRNAVIDFSKMTVSAVAVVTDAVRGGSRWWASASTPTAAMPRAP